MAAYEAIIETCRERARPVVLTAVTAILGVLPIVFGMNIEFTEREITIGPRGGYIFPPRSCSGSVSRPCSRWW